MFRNRRLVDYKPAYTIAYGWKNLIWSILQIVTLAWGIVSAVTICLIFVGFMLNVVFGNMAFSGYFKLISHLLTNPRNNLVYVTIKEVFARATS